MVLWSGTGAHKDAGGEPQGDRRTAKKVFRRTKNRRKRSSYSLSSFNLDFVFLKSLSESFEVGGRQWAWGRGFL